MIMLSKMSHEYLNISKYFDSISTFMEIGMHVLRKGFFMGLSNLKARNRLK